jgi:di/tricarboxylate transporter
VLLVQIERRIAGHPVQGRDRHVRLGFRARYNAAVMAIHRADGDVGGQLGQVTLRAGDVLLVLADDSFAARWRGHADFSLVAALDEQPPARRDRSMLVVLATAGLVVVAVSGVLNLFEAALASAIVVVAGRAVSVSQAWRSINVNVVATMAAAISLGSAVSASGLAADSRHSGCRSVGAVAVAAISGHHTADSTAIRPEVPPEAPRSLLAPIGVASSGRAVRFVDG